MSNHYGQSSKYLTCDAPECPATFTPANGMRLAPREMRQKAAAYNWTSEELVDGTMIDLCPQHEDDPVVHRHRWDATGNQLSRELAALADLVHVLAAKTAEAARESRYLQDRIAALGPRVAAHLTEPEPGGTR